MDIFFAQLFGVYFVLVGLIVLVRQRSIMPTVKELLSNRSMVLVLGVVEFAAGLALVLAYPVPALSLTGVLSVIGWTIAIEGLLYIALPIKIVQRYVKMFNKPVWYKVGGLLSIIAGIYLAGTGFGLI